MAGAEGNRPLEMGVADGHLQHIALCQVGLVDFQGWRDGYLLEVATDRDGRLRLTVERDQLAEVQAAVAQPGGHRKGPTSRLRAR